MTRRQGHPESRKRLRKLWNFAAQDVSPNEGDNARRKLADGGPTFLTEKSHPMGAVVFVDQRGFKAFDDYLAWHDKREGGLFCPGCEHSEYQHVAAMCYTCGYCGWSISEGKWHRGL